MRRKVLWIVAVVVVALALPATAGEEGYKCTKSTQDCLNAMAAKLKNRGWVGLQLDYDEATGAMTVKQVVPDSPAVAAGFQAGDVLFALNGAEFGADEEAVKAAYEAMTPGNVVTYTVLRDGAKSKLEVTLGEVPSDVLAQWIGGHMLDHVTVAMAEN